MWYKSAWASLVLVAGVATAAVLPLGNPDGQLVIHDTDELTDALREVSRLAADTWQTVQDVEARIEQAIGKKTHEAEDKVEELSADAWQSIQGMLGKADSGAERLVASFDAAAADAEHRVQTKVEDAFWHGGPPHEPLDLRKYTIGQILNWTLTHAHDGETHTLPLHKLGWLVNASEPVQEALYREDADITFFAPSDQALTPPHRRHHHSAVVAGDEAADASLAAHQGDHPFWEAAGHLRKEACPHHQARMRNADHDDDEDKDRRERRKRFFLKIVEVVLRYHISPKEKHVGDILDSATLPTNLTINPHEKDAPSFRIRVGDLPLLPFVPVKLNFFSALHPRPILAKNGVIYIIGDAPLLPPLSPLSQLFLFPNPFSTLTSAVQKVGLAHALLPHYDNKSIPLAVEEEDEVDERVMNVLSEIVDEKKKFAKQSFTVFAPTNRAFAKLGLEINAFLFSPFGSPILRYVLKYHVVPDLIFHTDHIDNTTGLSSTTEVDVPWPANLERADVEASWEWHGPHLPGPPRRPPCPTPPGQVNVTHYSLPTLLGSRHNETLNVDVVLYRLRFGKGPLARRVIAKPSPEAPKDTPRGPPKPVTASIADGVAWGGAVHVIPDLIAPPIPHGHGHGHDHHQAKRLRQLVAKLSEQ